MEDIAGQYCVALKSHRRVSRNSAGALEKRPVYNSNIKKMSGLVQGHLPGINVIRESWSSAGTMCFRERYSPGQLPAWTAGTHQPNMLDWKQGLIPEC